MVMDSFGKPACARISFTTNIAGSSFPGGLTVSAWINLERLATVSAVANFQLMGSLIIKLTPKSNQNSIYGRLSLQHNTTPPGGIHLGQDHRAQDQTTACQLDSGHRF